jgi:uncharacterized protein
MLATADWLIRSMSAMPPMLLPAWIFPVMLGTGLVAGFVDSIAGGGGLITLPVLLSLGLPPGLALGTNKLQATFGSGSAAWHFAQSNVVSLRGCREGVLFTSVGAAAGALVVQRLDPSFLKAFIPVVLIVLVAYLLLRPELGEKDIHPRMAAGSFYALSGLTLGFYDGFLGPGTGSFWCMAFMLGLGFNLMKATGYTKVMNFASNLVSLVLFATLGHVAYVAGLTMGIGQVIGARIGSRMVVAHGAKFIRPIFILVVLTITLKLLVDAHHQ